ncbi:AMP-binding enzyme family protein [Mycobacterium kansasii]|uniref:AMP-binding enzyme family protein n=1 Tax=Mycobacterium kansasii TaxID=1768 RepID=A0A1V3WV58_MYCKA|nr:AMP-binding enzyme family protein [Mycobacterium kansasii]
MNSRQRVDELREQFSDAHADVAWLLCDRHPAQRIAFTVVGDGGSVSMTFGELATASHRSAQAFRAAGVRRGDRVATLMGKSVDLVVTILATWRLGAVYVPLFTAFGADAIAERLERSGAVLVVADPDQRHKLAPAPTGRSWSRAPRRSRPTATDCWPTPSRRLHRSRSTVSRSVATERWSTCSHPAPPENPRVSCTPWPIWPVFRPTWNTAWA